MARARVIAIVHRHAAPRHAAPSRVVRDLQRWWHALVNHLLDTAKSVVDYDAAGIYVIRNPSKGKEPRLIDTMATRSDMLCWANETPIRFARAQ